MEQRNFWIVILIFIIFLIITLVVINQYKEGNDSPVNMCGIVGKPDVKQTAYIVNGKNSFAGKFPWVISLGNCGGSIIAPKWVMTAAHCQIEVGSALAAGVFNRAVEEPQRQIRRVLKVINHPDYSQTNLFANDICLLEVDKPFLMTKFVKPVCLPSITTLDIKSATITAMGWGSVTGDQNNSATIMQEADLKIMPAIAAINQTIQFAAGAGETTTTCFGDSGGPLVVLYNERATQVGIVSFGVNPCKPPSYYTRVSYFVPWIESVVGKGIIEKN
jgi:secreted trypsin-like serine protease